MNALEILLELVTIEEAHAAKLRALYAKAANSQAQPVPHHVGADALREPRERPQTQRAQPPQKSDDNYPPVNEICDCGEAVDRKHGNYKTGRRVGEPYVMSHCPKPISKSCGYKKWYDPIPVPDHSSTWQHPNNPDF
jgi:hypothetical protein